MNKQTILLVAGLLASASLPLMAKNPAAPGQHPQSFTGQVTKKVSVNYLLFLPEGYDLERRKRWPLILFLHGAGERGTNVNLVAVHGPPKIVAKKPGFPFVVVSPQCPSGQRWDNDVVLALLDDIEKNYRIDKKQIYLTGLSMGGYGTWSLGLTRPERFAAIVPICGGGDPLLVLLADPKKQAALKSLPVWAFHGAKDPVVPLQESRRMIDALKQFGCRELELTVYPEAQHDSWTETYDNPKLYDWLLQHSRP